MAKDKYLDEYNRVFKSLMKSKKEVLVRELISYKLLFFGSALYKSMLKDFDFKTK